MIAHRADQDHLLELSLAQPTTLEPISQDQRRNRTIKEAIVKRFILEFHLGVSLDFADFLTA